MKKLKYKLYNFFERHFFITIVGYALLLCFIFTVMYVFIFGVCLNMIW